MYVSYFAPSPHSYLQSPVMRRKWWHLSRKCELLTLQPLWFSSAVIHHVTQIVYLNRQFTALIHASHAPSCSLSPLQESNPRCPTFHVLTFSPPVLLHFDQSGEGLAHKCKRTCREYRHDTLEDYRQTSWHLAAWHVPLASLSKGLNSFLFSGGSCLAATSCLRCLQCLFVVTWNTPEKKTQWSPCDSCETWGQSTACNRRL